jgi:hypothetical protein
MKLIVLFALTLSLSAQLATPPVKQPAPVKPVTGAVSPAPPRNIPAPPKPVIAPAEPNPKITLTKVADLSPAAQAAHAKILTDREALNKETAALTGPNLNVCDGGIRTVTTHQVLPEGVQHRIQKLPCPTPASPVSPTK